MTTTYQEHFTCPISHQIFKHPVLAEDGHFYEKMEIEKFIKNTMIILPGNSELGATIVSPMTNQPIYTKLKRSYVFESMLNLFLKQNSNLVANQYFEIKNHKDYSFDVKLIFQNKISFYKLHEFTKFDLSLLSDGYLTYFLQNADIDIIKYFIDNLENLDYSYLSKLQLIHLVCKHNNIEIIKYLVKKGINIDCESNQGWCPIHAVCHYGSAEIIRYFLTLNSKKLGSKINDYEGNTVTYGAKELTILNSKLSPTEKIEIIELISQLSKST